jgi:hypothetical protein
MGACLEIVFFKNEKKEKMEMKKNFKGYSLHVAVMTCLALVLGLTGVAFGHDRVILYDGDGNAITDAAGANPNKAYSAEWSCGSCHTYANIEEHSYHAQIGSNQQVGWMAYNPNHTNPYISGVATKGKSWVQSPGHVGKW